jgi:hypothetical protein
MREIIESTSFREAVQKLGGARAIDAAFETLAEALYHNPFGFPLFENDWTQFRYARTKEIDFIPPLVFIFTIDANKNVVLEHVEKDEDAG